MARQVGRHRIRANAIAPGVVDTKLTAPGLATTEQRVDRVSVVLYVTGGQVATSDVFRWARAHNPVPESAGI